VQCVCYVLVERCLYDVALVGCHRASSVRQPARQNLHSERRSELADMQHVGRERAQATDEHVV